MKSIYFISGLGADERAFGFLKINNPNVKFIPWIIPERNESLDHYVHRLTGQIEDSGSSIVIGLSFGGIIVVELSKILNFKKTIIISSIKSSAEKPGYLRFLKLVKLYKLVPERLFNKYNFIISYAFGISGRFERELLKNVISETDPVLVKWAIDKIVNWNSSAAITNLVHIHGSKDRLFPLKNIRNVVRVEGGSHFMIVNKPDIISSIINRELV